MLKNVVKFILFLLPVGILYLVPAYMLHIGREWMSVTSVAQEQQSDASMLLSTAYAPQSIAPYKIALINIRKPHIIAVGTSRTMQIRQEFFADQKAFTNAGGVGYTVTDIARIVDALPADASSTMIIIGIDREIFLKKPGTQSDFAESSLPVRVAEGLSSIRRIYLDLLHKKVSFTTLTKNAASSTSVGIAALMTGNGFRQDGSYSYAQSKTMPHLQDDVATAVAQTVDAIHSDHYIDPLMKSMTDANLAVFDALLQNAHKKGITVIAFLPPYPTPIYTAMHENTNSSYGYLVNTLPQQLQDIFAKNDATFFDFPTADTFGGTESEYVDAVHGTDLMAARMMLYMAAHNDALASSLHTTFLRTSIAHAKGNFLPF